MTPRSSFSLRSLLSPTAVLAALILIRLALYVWSNTGGAYGYFRDELYYLAAAEHLDLGYVDYPPFAALMAALTRTVLDTSLLALHFFPTLAGIGIIILTFSMAKQLGGGPAAQILAALAATATPIFIGASGILTMDPFDELWWVLAAYVLILLLKRQEPKLWLAFGLVAGIGLLTKVTIAYLGFALVAGLLLTPARRLLWNRWLLAGGLIALLIFSPYIVWQLQHGWPTLEFWRTYASGKTYPVSPLEFLVQQILIVGPLALPLWLAGIYFYLFSGRGQPYRALGWAYLMLYVVLTLMRAKNYFLAPAYPMLFAGGAVLFEGWLRARRWAWVTPAYASLVLITGLALATQFMPLLPAETAAAVTRVMGGDPAQMERHQPTELPQLLADRFGWPEMVAGVAQVYQSLPADERAQACIFTVNYGEAGAIDFFGPEYGLPKAISGHNGYWIWGPGSCSGAVIVSVGFSVGDVSPAFERVEKAATLSCDYCMGYEDNLPVFVLRRLKMPMRDAWVGAKSYN